MRKALSNFQQPKCTPTFLTLLLIFLLTACQKDNLQELEDNATSYTETTTAENQFPNGDISLNLEFDPNARTEVASSRSATYLMYSGTFSVGSSKWKNFYYTSPQLPDPSVWRVEVTIRPLAGNPDLYLYGYDQDSGSPWRYIRSSQNGGLADEEVSFRRTGMKGAEERIYMSVYGRTNARFEIIIAAVTVDCEEYPSADQWVTLEYNPVCGCNGVEYPNPSSASVNGVTSWTVGPCVPVIDGFWRNIDPNTRGITKLKLKDNAKTIQVWGACSPNECDWKDADLYYDGKCYTAKYKHGYATRYLKLHQEPNGQMRLEMRSDFHDGRTDKTEVYYFKK